MSHMSRTYGQFCPLARALDRVGDRWTLLVVRDLVAGPKRYSDLLAGLPGIGTTLLAERLRRLEDEGVLGRRELPPPAAATVYELTAAGHELVEAMVPLATWGLRYLDKIGDDEVSPEWVLMFWKQHLDPEKTRGVHDVYEMRVGRQVFHLAVDDGVVTGAVTPAPRPPDVVVKTDWKTFVDVGFGRLDPLRDDMEGLGSVEGSPAAIERFFTLVTPVAPFAVPRP
jgi:DNA-binding HxlR family transcriptional regulator